MQTPTSSDSLCVLCYVAQTYQRVVGEVDLSYLDCRCISDCPWVECPAKA